MDDPYRRDFIQHADFICISGVNLPSLKEARDYFLAKNPRQIILVGRGSQGCTFITNSGLRDFVEVEMEELVVDTNGAGDALAAGFLHSYCIEGISLEQAVFRGQILARYVCSLKAPKSNLLNHAQLDGLVNQFLG